MNPCNVFSKVVLVLFAAPQGYSGPYRARSCLHSWTLGAVSSLDVAIVWAPFPSDHVARVICAERLHRSGERIAASLWSNSA